MFYILTVTGKQTSCSATAEIARDADDVDFSVDVDVHSALTLARLSQTDGTDKP